jgi:hypothetical protein
MSKFSSHFKSKTRREARLRASAEIYESLDEAFDRIDKLEHANSVKTLTKVLLVPLLILIGATLNGCGGPTDKYTVLTGPTHYVCEPELCDIIAQSVKFWQPHVPYRLSSGPIGKDGATNYHVSFVERGFIPPDNPHGWEMCKDLRGAQLYESNVILFCDEFAGKPVLQAISDHEMGHSIGLRYHSTGVMLEKVRHSVITPEVEADLHAIYGQ